MNERIRELAKQCWDQRLDGRHFDQEMFAELIVLEVLNVQENLMANGHNAWHLYKPTKKHFGIEE